MPARWLWDSTALLGLLASLLHFEPQQTRFGTAGTCSPVSVLAVEGITAFVQSIHQALALGLVVVVLGQAAYGAAEAAVSLAESRGISPGVGGVPDFE